MPVYLCHGFRWHRRSIQYFVVLRDIDDAAPAWIVAPHSAVAILETFYGLYDFIPPSTPSRGRGQMDSLYQSKSNSSFNQSPTDSPRGSKMDGDFDNERRRRDPSASSSSAGVRNQSTTRSSQLPKPDETHPLPSLPPPSPPEDDNNIAFNDWSTVKFLEEFDPSNETVACAPWAYVADYVVRVDTSKGVMEEMQRYEERMKLDKNKAMSGPGDETGRTINTMANPNAGWFEKLRDKLQRGEEIRWYIVVCGDEERAIPGVDSDDEYTDSDEEDVVTTIGDGEMEDQREQARAQPIVKKKLEFRLPEFADVAMRPLKVLSEEQKPPPVPEKDFPPTPPQRKLSETLKNPPTPPQQQVLPEKNYTTTLPRKTLPIRDYLTAGPRPNMPEQPKLSMDGGRKPKTPRVGTGIRKLFAKRNVESPTS